MPDVVRLCRSLAAAIVLNWVVPAWADDPQPPLPDKSAFTLFNPTPSDALRGLASDRPTKSFSPITVDAGHIQIESDIGNYARGTFQGVRTENFVAVDPVFKLGLTNFADLEIQFGGYQMSRSVDTSTRAVTAYGRGFGDMIVKTKVNFVGNDGGVFALSLAPYVKIPSGVDVISNGRVESGVQAPFLVNLPGDFTFVSTPELAFLRTSDGIGTHTVIRNVVNLSHAIPGIDNLTGLIEFYASYDTARLDPRIYTLDFGLGYLLTPACQLDVGLNVGLNQAAPALQIYAGITQRF